MHRDENPSYRCDSRLRATDARGTTVLGKVLWGVKTVVWILLCLLVGLTVWELLRRMHYLWERPNPPRRADIWSYPFRTGDLILTSARWDPRSDLGIPLRRLPSFTKGLTSSVYNHAAVAYVDERTGQTFFWEMTSGGTRMASIHDLTCGRPRHDIVVRPLNRLVDVRTFESVVMSQWENVFDYGVGMTWCKRFGREIWRVPIPFLDRYRGGKEGSRTCVHAVVEMYARLGVLDYEGSTVDPSTIFASDLGREPIDTAMLPLANGYELGPPVLLEFEEKREHPPLALVQPFASPCGRYVGAEPEPMWPQNIDATGSDTGRCAWGGQVYPN